MKLKLILKNSWMRLKREIKIILILFCYITFAMGTLFGTFALSSSLKEKLIIEPFKTNIRIDGGVRQEQLHFFTDEIDEQYNTIMLKIINSYLPEDSKLKDDSEYLQLLAKNFGNTNNIVLTSSNIKTINEILQNNAKSFYGNIFKKAFADFLSSANFYVNSYCNERIKNLDNKTASITFEDFSFTNLRETEVKREIAQKNVPSDVFGVYMQEKFYHQYKGKTFQVILNDNTTVFNIKIIGYAKDYSNLIMYDNLNMVADAGSFNDFALKNDINLSTFSNAQVVIEDDNVKEGQQNVDGINQFLKSPRYDFKETTSELENPIEADPDSTVVYWQYKSVQRMYQMLVFLITAILTILTCAIMLFVLRQMINSERKILYFLKNLGTSRAKLALINVADLFYPIFFALIVAVPIMFFVKKMLFHAIGESYNFVISVFSISWPIYIFVGLAFVAVLALFFLLVFINISDRILNPNRVGELSKTERALNKWKPAVKKVFRVKNNLWISFINKNIYQNIVTMITIALAVGILLFSQIFSASASKTTSGIENYYGSYKTKTTYDGTVPFYKNSDILTYGTLNSQQTMEENDLNTDKKINRRITFNFDNTEEPIGFSFYDKEGKQVSIDLKNPSPTDIIKLENDFDGRYVNKDDLNMLLKSHYQFSDDFGTQGQKIDAMLNQARIKVTQVKQQYPSYNGTSLSFGTNYVLDEEEESEFFSFEVREHNKGNDAIVLPFTPKGSSQNNELSKGYRQLSVVNYDFLKRTNLQWQKYLTGKVGAKKVILPKNYDPESLIIDSPFEKNAEINFFKYLLVQNASHNKIEVPVVNAIGPSDFKTDDYVNVPIFRYYESTTNQQTTFYLPVFLHIVKVDNYNPEKNLFVNSVALKKVVNLEMKKLKDNISIFSNAKNDLYKNEIKNAVQKWSGSFINNSFMTTKIPRGFQEIVFAANGDRAKFSSYNIDDNLLVNPPFNVMDYQAMGQSAWEVFSPISNMVKMISMISTVIAILVSFLLIYLILKENEQIIKMLKILGYRKREIVRFIIFGYSIATFFAVLIAIGIAFLMFLICSHVIIATYNYHFMINFSLQSIMTAIFSPSAYIILVVLGIEIQAYRQNVNSIDQAN